MMAEIKKAGSGTFFPGPAGVVSGPVSPRGDHSGIWDLKQDLVGVHSAAETNLSSGPTGPWVKRHQLLPDCSGRYISPF